MHLNRKKYLFFVFVNMVFFVSSCSPQKSYVLLSFFFDGVPDPNISELVVFPDSILVADTSNVIIASNIVVRPLFVSHAPYSERKCGNCHDRGNMGKTIEPQPQLCYKCHNNFEKEYKSTHGPVGGGHCTACHEPHKSKSENLLISPAQKLCISCHDSSLVYNSDFHVDNLITECLECHNPHGGENRFVLQAWACYKCHQDFKQEFAYLHGPMNGGYCLTCHSSHAKSTDNLLKIEGNQLCFDCHDSKLIFENEKHQNKSASCINCHNPHGGNDRIFTILN